MYFIIMYFRSKTTFTLSMYTQIKFSWTDNGKVQKLFILKLDPEPEKLSEHGARAGFYNQITTDHMLYDSLCCSYKKNES